jgi:hypothetical protein
LQAELVSRVCTIFSSQPQRELLERVGRVFLLKYGNLASL